MKIVDANVILRYLLDDVEELSLRASQIIENEEVFIPNEVLAEIVYVLEKVYTVERNDIKTSLINLLGYDNITFSNNEVIAVALDLFAERKLDFVDTLLYGYHNVEKHSIYTFDKKLQKILT